MCETRQVQASLLCALSPAHVVHVLSLSGHLIASHWMVEMKRIGS